MSKASVLNVRLDYELAERVKAEALRQDISANKLLVSAIKQYLRAEKDREWRRGFEELANDPEGNNVEYMIPAALEVIDAE